MQFRFDGQRVVPARLQNTQADLIYDGVIGKFVLPKPRDKELHIVFRNRIRERDTVYRVNNGSGEMMYFFNNGNLAWEMTVDRQPIIEISNGRLWSMDIDRGDPVDELFKAFEARDLTLMSKLLNSNRDLVNAPYNGGMTLIMLGGDPEIVKMAIGAGANVNARDINGSTPLHYAAYYGDQEVAELLMGRGANVNAKDALGNTPLHVAIKMGNRSVASYLTQRGADINIRNSLGQTPLNAAFGN